MFSGIVETVGTVREMGEGEGVRTLRIDAPAFGADLAPGDSISVDGACLTVVEPRSDGFTVQVVGTTLERTIAAGYAVGSRVNLERALPLGGRLDGHLVQGHVDGTAPLDSVREKDGFHLLVFTLPQAVADLTILHGSITFNGVSLTVNRIDGLLCEVAVIPFTRAHTNLGTLARGDRVNVEGDLLGKYVEKLLTARLGAVPSSPVSSPSHSSES